MTFRDGDDDTSSGKTTQGGHTPRRGNTIFWVLGLAVIVVAIVIAAITLPKKRSPAEEGTGPVSTPMNATGPSTAAGTATVPQAGPVAHP